MRIPKYYNHHTSAFGIAIFGLAYLDSEYYDFEIGLEARKDITKVRTYRVRTGNGHYGSVLGQKYQDTMNYKVVTDRKTDDQQANRNKFKDAMADAMMLTEEQRTPYKERAKEEREVTWFNIFIRDYMIS
ncbi:hypothetical protein ES703_118349 [subsurface metagenome]